MVQLLEVHRIDFVIISYGVGFLKSIVFQRDNHLLLLEINLLKLESRISVFLCICFLIIASVVQNE